MTHVSQSNMCKIAVDQYTWKTRGRDRTETHHDAFLWWIIIFYIRQTLINHDPAPPDARKDARDISLAAMYDVVLHAI